MSNIWHKLNLKEQREIVVVSAPASFEVAIDELEDVRVQRTLSDRTAIAFMLAFITKREEIAPLAQAIGKQAEGDAIVWLAYPKGSSKRVQCDFNRDTGFSPLGTVGFEGVRQVAIDDDWSALRFRRVEFIRKITRDPQRAMTKAAKERIRRH